MTVSLEEIMAKLPQERQDRIKAEAKELIAKQMTFQELRKARKLSLEKVAKLLDLDRAQVLKLEQHTDLFLTTLHSCVEELGGKLQLTAEFPDRPAVILTDLADLVELEEEGLEESLLIDSKN
ncbi:putative transcriptional regulator [Thalassoporum mexicanum PCC 7367]|uniref:XRE family transcriptional regulator n=1 Tax=Thalassoporum mexicanum TaxID=3457544 RepID=UPI00029FE9D8|nr:XRE family transcriptional regulator [Pseudanabaena sp. PCC 7367]AFY68431.1 putative transcriptional regulator [Pseudanabaena sp. PCC 7367]